jgi:hypothetical protein
MKRLTVMAVCLFAGCGVCRAQSASGAATTDNSSQSEPARRKDETGKTGNQRLFGVIPNYGTVNDAAPVAPMTSGDKIKLSLHYFDPYNFAFVALRAGVDQALDAKSGYGQGMQGYGKRYGADFADGLSNSIFGRGVFPSLLHQDPRYFRRGQGSTFSRASYAASRVLITRQDSGRKSFNFSELLGNAASSGISTLYYPENDRTAGDFAVRAGLQFGFNASFNVVKEFYPDIVRKFRKTPKQPVQPPGP